MRAYEKSNFLLTILDWIWFKFWDHLLCSSEPSADLASHWLGVITWPGQWPLIGHLLLSEPRSPCGRPRVKLWHPAAFSHHQPGQGRRCERPDQSEASERGLWPIRGRDLCSRGARGQESHYYGQRARGSHLVPFNLLPPDFSQHFSSDSFCNDHHHSHALSHDLLSYIGFKHWHSFWYIC